MTQRLRCSRCGRVKAVAQFYPRPDTRRRYRSSCKSCSAGMNREYYKGNSARIIDRVTERRKPR